MHQSSFLEIFYSTGVKRGGKSFEHAFFCQIREGGMLLAEPIQIIKYDFRYRVDDIFRDLGGSAESCHDAESVHVVNRSCQAGIKALHLKCPLGVILFVSHQSVNGRAGKWNDARLTLPGQSHPYGLTGMPDRVKISVDAVVLEQDRCLGGIHCLGEDIPLRNCLTFLFP
jgi:hypothetical protein